MSSPPGVWDGTIAAQKALSCVYRTGQRFDPEYLIDVLRGNHNESVSKWGYDKISTFGIGKEFNKGAWHAVFRQLTVLGYLAWDNADHRSLHLTPACRAVLKGEQIIHLRLSSKRKPSTSARRMHDSISPNSQNLGKKS
ncbi:RQC domain-containing protein [Nitrosomonas sp. Is37]|uniref:RQC domain-containing protein n=1 Tax=Nitrosomonas sp. Is37 TaxID=3080535 RepID=UPI00294B3E9D|nr:RQC domain-containing protein [Nitrosomonas sp. Is37]MDV6345663.1 RQC domain-containing protein [Nitrosomonas sp. Is37]